MFNLKFHSKFRKFVFFRPDAYFAVVVLNYLPAEVKSYARGLTCRLGRKKRVENLVQNCLLNADSVVVKLYKICSF